MLTLIILVIYMYIHVINTNHNHKLDINVILEQALDIAPLSKSILICCK